MNFHFVCSTHLDREWYASSEQFRYHMCAITDRVLEMLEEHPQFIYMWDGQTSVIEDYLEIYPEKEHLVRKFMAEHRLIAGPWFIQPDEFLVCGESHIRNLLLGHQQAAAYGGRPMGVGYLPDSFGHIAQMPQILQGFGIENAFFMRGVLHDVEREFYWQAPDGSRVLAVHCSYGMTSVMDINNMEDGIRSMEGVEAFLRKVEDSLKKGYLPESSTSEVLITYNSDHLPPRETLPDDLAAANGQLPLHELFISSMEQFFRNTRSYQLTPPTLVGELRQGDDIKYLGDTAAARAYLKIANRSAENMLLAYAEPLSAFAWCLGGTYPQAFLRQAWKNLLLNHTHDGICGCSINAVHDEMMVRFQKVQDIGQMILDREINAIVKQVNTSDLGDGDMAIWLYHPHLLRHDAVVELSVDHRYGNDLNGLRIQNADGVPAAFQIISNHPHELIEWEFEIVQRFTKRHRAVIALHASELPAVGYSTFTITNSDNAGEVNEKHNDPVSKEFMHMENEHIAVILRTNGTFDLEEKQTGSRYEQQHYFVDGGDAGDVYNYLEPENDTLYDSRHMAWDIQLMHNGPLSAQYMLSCLFPLPASLSDDKKSRSTSMLDTPLSYTITLRKGSAVVEIATTIDNHSRDHRMRVYFPSHLKAASVFDDGHFITNQRGLRDFPYAHPHRNFVDLNDGQRGLALFNRGTSQYEVLEDAQQTLALTLLKCQDVLYRWAFDTRLEAFNGSQLQGVSTFEYAVFPHAGSWEEANLPRLAGYYSSGCFTKAIGRQSGTLPKQLSFIDLESPSWVLDSVRKQEERNSLIVRFHNRSDDTTIGRIRVFAPIEHAYKVNLMEVRLLDLPLMDDNSLHLAVKPHEIVTLELCNKPLTSF